MIALIYGYDYDRINITGDDMQVLFLNSVGLIFRSLLRLFDRFDLIPRCLRRGSSFLIGCFLTTFVNSAQAQGFWEKKEMDPRLASRAAVVEVIPKIVNVDLLPRGAAFSLDPPCDGPYPCTFDLYYFTGRTFDLNDPDRRNILFIAGGPGQFIDETADLKEKGGADGNAALGALDGQGTMIVEGRPRPEVNGKHNLVYFHVRGAGRSIIAGVNHRDQYLRAKYVVEDIEKIRQAVLGDKPWDAIYAYSWGTIVAQLYASKYGQPDIAAGRAAAAVKSLILSAPVVRKNPQTLAARINQTVKNLTNIYRFFRPDDACNIIDVSYLKAKVADFDTKFVSAMSSGDLNETDNLCFVTDSRLTDIARQVENILSEIEEDYGSVDFVVDEARFKELQRDPIFPNSLKQYPREFYGALRKLQMSGAPDEDALVLTPEAKSMINIALLLGYYLTPKPQPELDEQCDPTGQFLVGPAADPALKAKYCERLVAAKEEFIGSQNSYESERARSVFGVYDGVARWVPKALNLNTNCFTGNDIAMFANSTTGMADRKKHLRNYALKLGVDTSATPICGWDPGGANAHSVPTLILAGTADAIIAGCQAEDFYNDGLRGARVFLEFRGMGHAMTVADTRNGVAPVAQTQTLADLIERWVIDPSGFANFIATKPPELEALRSSLRKAENGVLTCRQ